MFNLYISRPMTGLSGKEVWDYYQMQQEKFGEHFKILCPMTGKAHLATNQKLVNHNATNPICTDHAICQRDNWMVSKSDIIKCDLTDERAGVSIGCVAELAVGSYLNKHTITILRPDGIYNHPFVFDMSDVVFYDVGEADDYILQLH